MLVACKFCGRLVNVSATKKQIDAWLGGELIQNAMSNVPPDERELLISGICPTCWDDMFGEEGKE